MLYNKNHLRVFMNPAAVRDKKGEIGETITWLVATVIIIIMLLISIFAVSSIFRKYKKFEVCKERDLLVTKSLTSYLLTKDDSGREIFYHLADKENLGAFNEKLAEKENLGDFGYNLAKKIFSELYKKEYIAYNIFFSSSSSVHEISLPCEDGISEEIKLKENEHLLLTLPKPK